jgi:hypothetical protein
VAVAKGPAEVRSDAPSLEWADRVVLADATSERLFAEQPEQGLLWVVGGCVTVSRDGVAREIPAGSVVAYRLAPTLEWRAAPGTRVRSSERPVRVAAGGIQPWTADLTLDVPQVDAARGRRRRRFMTALTVAMAWIVAIAVAWCYSDSHAQRLDTSAVPLREASTAEQSLREAVVAEVAAEGFALSDATAVAGSPPPAPAKSKFVGRLALPGNASPEARRRLGDALRAAATAHRIDRLVVLLMDGGKSWMSVTVVSGGEPVWSAIDSAVAGGAGKPALK